MGGNGKQAGSRGTTNRPRRRSLVRRAVPMSSTGKQIAIQGNVRTHGKKAKAADQWRGRNHGPAYAGHFRSDPAATSGLPTMIWPETGFKVGTKRKSRFAWRHEPAAANWQPPRAGAGATGRPMLAMWAGQEPTMRGQRTGDYEAGKNEFQVGAERVSGIEKSPRCDVGRCPMDSMWNRARALRSGCLAAMGCSLNLTGTRKLIG